MRFKTDQTTKHSLSTVTAATIIDGYSMTSARPPSRYQTFYAETNSAATYKLQTNRSNCIIQLNITKKM